MRETYQIYHNDIINFT